MCISLRPPGLRSMRCSGHPQENPTMTLTVDVLDRLHAEDVDTAAALVQRSSDGAALIELLEMLWHIGIPRAKALIAPVLERLAQLHPAE